MKNKRVIHLIRIMYGTYPRAICGLYSINVKPIEAKLFDKRYRWVSLGTFDINKVTCKKCLKHKDYKKLKHEQDVKDYPLFFWKEKI